MDRNGRDDPIRMMAVNQMGFQIADAFHANRFKALALHLCANRRLLIYKQNFRIGFCLPYAVGGTLTEMSPANDPVSFHDKYITIEHTEITEINNKIVKY